MNVAPMLVYIAVACFTPGPNNLMVMYLSAEYGIAGARRFIVSSTVCFCIKMLLCGALNLALASLVPAAVPYLKWIGAAYMIYLAVHMLLSGWRKKDEPKADGAGQSSYRSGVLLQLLNVKSWVFALSVFSIYVIPYTGSVWSVILCAAISTLAMLTATLLWGMCGHAIRNVYSRYIRVCSTLMALSLVWCAVTALL